MIPLIRGVLLAQVVFAGGLMAHGAAAQTTSAGEADAVMQNVKSVKTNFTRPTILPLPPSDVLPERRPSNAATTPANNPAEETKYVKNNKDNVKPSSSNQKNDNIDVNSLFEDAEAAPIPDPSEDRNRQLLDFNIFLDRAFLKPIANTVTVVLPAPVAQILRNILENLQEPSKFVYLALSGHFSDSFLTLSRFAINSTIGVAGAFDPASSFTPALRTKDATADLMLASWGVPIGNYNVSFFVGPSNQRASLAGYIDSVLSPSGIAISLLFPANDTSIKAGLTGGRAVLNRPVALDSIADFADPYAVARSVYWQAYQEREKKYINKK